MHKRCTGDVQSAHSRLIWLHPADLVQLGSAKGGDGEWRWRRHSGGAAAIHPRGAALAGGRGGGIAGDRSGRDQAPPDRPGHAVDATGATERVLGAGHVANWGDPKPEKVLASCAE
jgi:hypothetical protein